ncbi:MAG: outer membrane beta-barrel protein [Kiritimatiellales bacterium]|nr:porin family protein [Pontiella sp.]NNJ70947.1 outer membrane beta-barrel protein [Kiritimatiellales bacterium]
MNGKKMLVKAWMIGFALCIAASASAVQLRGNDYMAGGLDVYDWQNPSMDVGYGRSYGASVLLNQNLEENWDGYISYAGFSDKAQSGTIELERHTILVGLNYLILPERLVLLDQPFTPYFGGSAGIVASEENGNSMSDAAFGLMLGAEWAMCSDAFLDINLFYSFVDDGISENDDAGIRFSTGVQIIEKLIGTVGASYKFDAQDAVITVGATIEF